MEENSVITVKWSDRHGAYLTTSAAISTNQTLRTESGYRVYTVTDMIYNWCDSPEEKQEVYWAN